MIRIHTILHATDFSETARQALYVAHLLARDHGAKLVLMHVVRPMMAGSASPRPPQGAPDPIEQARQRLATEAARIADGPLEARVVSGESGAEIVAAARQCDADLIVMGTHSQADVGRPCIGSVAEHVVRHAPCAVLTLKPGAGWGLSQESAEASEPQRPTILTGT